MYDISTRLRPIRAAGDAPSGRVLDRRGFLCLVGVALAAGAVGCGSGDRAPALGAPAPPPPGGGFPVTIEGSEGVATVPAAPSRVVSVGTYRDTDAAVAFGVVPLLTPDLSQFLPGGITPWVAAALPGAPPELIQVVDGLPLEKIVATDPDLILATDLSAVAENYGVLSRIAPTLSPAAGYNKDTWQVTTERVGAALGLPDRAVEIIAATEKLVTDARDANPVFAGRTFTIGPVQADGTINTINSQDDASARFMRDLGLRLSPSVDSLPSGNFPGRAVVGPESLAALDADVLILTFNTPQARERLEADELFQKIAAVRRGSYVALDLTTAIAIAFPSALSIPYALEESIPELATALNR